MHRIVPAGHERSTILPANDNQAAMGRALRELGERAVERILGAAGAMRFALLLAGI
jgi:hypothetical protein